MSQPTPAEKFRIALDLHEAGLRMHEQTLRRRYPEAGDEQIREALFAWLTRQSAARGLTVRDAGRRS
ncbi:hypothetical protein [Glycomyces salinus]|uniref:hypothetical protein n=1 Tax=Glycomyces salinus TaxID=980294 RepID=UPI0018EAE44F|nr:hypothetical protein [Glycomyces salinus]